MIFPPLILTAVEVIEGEQTRLNCHITRGYISLFVVKFEPGFGIRRSENKCYLVQLLVLLRR
jgi:hypothetical protein